MSLPVSIVTGTMGLFACILMGSVAEGRNLSEYDEQSRKQARSAPLVVVGVVDSRRPFWSDAAVPR